MSPGVRGTVNNDWFVVLREFSSVRRFVVRSSCRLHKINNAQWYINDFIKDGMQYKYLDLECLISESHTAVY